MTAPELVVDAIGNQHRRAAEPVRIVSLVPSLTELLCDLGLADRVVGRTGFCIHPRDVVKRIPKVGGTKDIDLKAVKALSPTHLVVNIDENPRTAVAELAQSVPHVFVTHPRAPTDNLRLFDEFGLLFSCETQAASLRRQFLEALALLSDPTHQERSRVLYLIWRDPWMTVSSDTYISRMLALINWQTAPQESSRRYPEISLRSFVDQVDRVLLSSEPYRFRRQHVSELRDIFGTRAVVDLVDGELLSWYGSRAIKGLQYLSHLQEPARVSVNA